MMRLILYSKPGCHLCEGLQEKLEQVQSLQFNLEVRDITTREDWFQAYQYEIPVLYAVPSDNSIDSSVQPDVTRSHLSNLDLSLIPLPRLSPRANVQQVEQMLKNYLLHNRAE